MVADAVPQGIIGHGLTFKRFIHHALQVIQMPWLAIGIGTSIGGEEFLLHELFSIPGHGMIAERKSWHLYDLYTMMNKDFAKKAIADDDE